jgi:hypothetical protein
MFNEFENFDFDFDEKAPDVSVDDVGLDNEIRDDEGAMAKADLFKLAKYSYKLYEKINDEDQLEGWVQAKITKAADYIASVYHYLEYEMKFSEYGKRIEDSDMYNESQKLELKNKLTEAKEKLAKIKIAQADKITKEKPAAKADTKDKKDDLDENATKVLPKKPATPKKLTTAKDTLAKKTGVARTALAKTPVTSKTAPKKDPKSVAGSAIWNKAKQKAIKENTDYPTYNPAGDTAVPADPADSGMGEAFGADKTPEEWAQSVDQMAKLLNMKQKYQGTAHLDQIERRIQALLNRLNDGLGPVMGDGGLEKAVVPPEQFTDKLPPKEFSLDEMRFLSGM